MVKGYIVSKLINCTDNYTTVIEKALKEKLLNVEALDLSIKKFQGKNR
jgi:hypothetical protein